MATWKAERVPAQTVSLCCMTRDKSLLGPPSPDEWVLHGLIWSMVDDH